MSELKTNLEQILQEKNEKIISQNIKKDVEVLGVTGSYDKEGIKELQDELADAEQELADVRRDLDNSTATISGSGEVVTLNGTAEARFKKPPLPLGNSEQESRNGYNLINLQDSTSTDVDVTRIIKDGKITLNGTPSNTNYNLLIYTFIATETGTYTLLPFKSSTNSNIRLLYQVNNGSFVNSDDTPQINLQNGDELKINLRISSTNAITNFVLTPMLYKGTDSKTYEKYGATPSPEFESPITNVTGDVEVKVQNKNLFDGSKEVNTNFTNSVATALNHFIQTGEYATGYCNNSNQISAYAGVYETCFVPISENTNYHISSQASENNGFSSINILDKNGNLLQSSNNWVGAGYAFTTPSNAKYLMFGTRIINIDYIQLIKGTTSIPLVPHKEQILPLTLGNIELCKIGDYQDYFYKESNKWYLHKEIAKKVLDGSENWGTSSTSTSGVYRPVCSVLNEIIKAPISSSNLPEVLCNYYKPITNDQSYTKVEGISISISGRIEIYDSNYNTNDISLYKTWLSTHNTEVYYALKTPTDTEITDTTLISQLEVIRKAISYDEQTNVSSNTIALFDIIALRNMNTVLNTLENDVDLLE